MAVYAVGDIQGCYDELLELLESVAFDPALDRLWLTGDLVNRGPRSLQVLRFVRALGESAVCVLGNHDLHLLAVACGQQRQRREKDTLDAVLEAPERDELLHWLRHLPLLHHELGYTLIHAGLPPQWSVAEAGERAREVERVLRGPQHQDLLAHMYGDQPNVWDPALSGWERLRFITNCLTRLRYCTRAGVLDMGDKGPPGSQRAQNLPWFEIPERASAGERIIFGHWSTLQLGGPVAPGHRVYPLDNGCIWGGRLSLLRLDDASYRHLPCPGWGVPHSRILATLESWKQPG